MALSLSEMCFNVSFLGTPDMITVLFFSVSWQTAYYENVNAIPSLSPINILLYGAFCSYFSNTSCKSVAKGFTRNVLYKKSISFSDPK